MYKAIFIFSDKLRIVAHFDECTDNFFTEAMQEDFEECKKENKPFYFGQYPLKKLFVFGKIEKEDETGAFDYWMDAKLVEDVKLWSIGKN